MTLFRSIPRIDLLSRLHGAAERHYGYIRPRAANPSAVLSGWMLSRGLDLQGVGRQHVVGKTAHETSCLFPQVRSKKSLGVLSLPLRWKQWAARPASSRYARRASAESLQPRSVQKLPCPHGMLKPSVERLEFRAGYFKHGGCFSRSTKTTLASFHCRPFGSQESTRTCLGFRCCDNTFFHASRKALHQEIQNQTATAAVVDFFDSWL